MKGKKKTILFVCTGNICRSPMAEGFLKERLEREGLLGIYEVRSAGLLAVEEAQVSSFAVQVMAEKGIDISHHRSHNLTLDDVEKADLILAMTRAHAEAIRFEFPKHKWKVYLLSEMVGRSYDIPDPYGGSFFEYRVCADEIMYLIEKGFSRIIE
jgi:protein-tyrosine phosphatase